MEITRGIIIKYLTYLSVLFFIASTFLVAASTYAEDTVKGNLTVNDKPVEIKHVYTDLGPDDVMVILTDAPVPEEALPFGVAAMAMEGKVRGIVLTIDSKTKTVGDGYNVLYHDAWEGQLGTIGNGVVTIDRMDDDVIEGTVKSTGPNTWTDAIEEKDFVYTFDVKFKAKIVTRDEPQ